MSYISVVIPTYNRLPVLRKLVRSLEKQSLSSNRFEVIVVDDGSNDGTYRWLSEYSGRLNINCIRHLQNKGTAATRNDGLRKAKGDIIVFLDDDVRVDAKLLTIYLDAHKREDGVYIGNVIYEKNKDERSLLQYLSTRGVHKGKRDFTCFITQNVSLRRKDAIDAGLFDESIPNFFQGEDIEFGYKLSILGKRFIYLKNAIAYHSHTINLQKVLLDAEKFGKQLLPLLVHKVPIFRKSYRINLLEPIHLLREPITLSLQKLMVRFSLRSSIYGIVKRITIFLNRYYIPAVFYDYLLFYNRTKWIRSNQSL